MRLILFDFDGTLTRRDTILRLGFFIARTQSPRFRKAARFSWDMFLLKSRVVSNHQFKEDFCRCLLTGLTAESIERLSREFYDCYVSAILKEPTILLLNKHRQAGDEVHIVTSNFDFVLQPVKRQLNADGVFATVPEIIDGRYTGRLTGQACVGSEKLTRVLARFGHERVRQAVAYGDSSDDRELLEFVKTPVWV